MPPQARFSAVLEPDHAEEVTLGFAGGRDHAGACRSSDRF